MGGRLKQFFLLVLCLTGWPLKQNFILIFIFYINDTFNGNMTENNFYAIIILIRIKIYKKFITPPRSAALLTSILI